MYFYGGKVEGKVLEENFGLSLKRSLTDRRWSLSCSPLISLLIPEPLDHYGPRSNCFESSGFERFSLYKVNYNLKSKQTLGAVSCISRFHSSALCMSIVCIVFNVLPRRSTIWHIPFND